MPPIKFLAYMIVPSVISEYITLKYIEYCWLDNRKRMALAESQPNVGICECCPGVAVKATYPIEGAHSHKREPLADKEATVPTKICRRGRNERRSRSNSNASDTSHAASEASAATAASASSRMRETVAASTAAFASASSPWNASSFAFNRAISFKESSSSCRCCS